jgi:hypothetical protein
MSYHPNYDDIGRKKKALVRAWMVLEMAYAPHAYQSATQLAEACGDALTLAGIDPHAVIPDDVYDVATTFFPDN